MSDERLRQIWAGFEQRTERRLTGRGVDNIVLPHRHDWRAEEASLLTEGAPEPARAAFDALKTRLAAVEAERAAPQKGRRRRGETQAAYDAGDEAFAAPLTADASFDAAPEAARDLIKGLRATEFRVARGEIDYGRFIASEAGRELESLKKKRKKFLGIF